MSKIIKNYLYNMSYQILVMILPIVTTPYISRILEPQGIGAYNYTYSIVTFIIVIAQLGTNLYGQREIAYVQADMQKRSFCFEEIFVIRFFSTILAFPIYFFVIYISKGYQVLLICMSIYLFANIFDISWLYQGLEEFRKTAIRNIAVKILGVVLTFLLVRNSDDLIIYVLILAVSQLIGNLCLWVGLNQRIRFIPLKKLIFKRHIKPILALFLPTAAMYIYTYVDKIILGLLSDDLQVGYYSQAEKIAKLLLTVITSLGSVLLPHISSAVQRKQIEKIRKEVITAINYVIRIGVPMTIGCIIISGRFIPIFLGSDYKNCIVLFSILSVLIVIIGLASVVGQAILIPMKKQKIYSCSIILGAIVNVALDILLVPICGALGASIGTIAAESTVTLMQLFCVGRLININYLTLLAKSRFCILSIVIMAAAGFVLNRWLPENYIGLVILILGCVVIYFFTLILFKDQMLFEFYEKIRSKRK